MQLSPYLLFSDNCAEALAFYQRCGLGQAHVLFRYGENAMPVRTEPLRGKILHARFEGPGVLFHASDNDDAEPMRGSAIMLDYPDLASMRTMFDRLAEGATITVPLGLQYWGSSFGMLIDAFGVQWLFTCATE